MLNDATASSPAPAPQPAPAPAARVSQDLDAMTAFAPDSETSGVARIDIDPSVRTAPVRQAPYPRRIAMGTGAVLVLLALLVVGMYELGQKHQVERVLDVLGISRGTGARDSASASTYAVSPAAPGTPQIAADAGAAKPIATEPTAADAASAKSMPSEPATAESPASAIASASPASGNRATLTDADTAAPAAVAQPRAPSPPPMRVARQNASRTPANPRAVCGARTDFALYRCMQLECSQRQWVSHPQCERLRINDSVD